MCRCDRLLQQNQIQKLLLLSSEEVTETAWIDTLVKKLKEAGVEATVETDILSSAAAREKAAGYEVAVLIAQVRRSAYDTLEQELGYLPVTEHSDCRCDRNRIKH